MGHRGVPLSLSTLSEYASHIAGRIVGQSWPRRFRERHSELAIKWSSGLEECRATNLNENVVSDFFAMYGKLIENYDIKPSNLYNMDEKGIQLGIGKRSRPVLVDRDQKVVQSIQPGNRELVTIIECLCADGSALHPSVVFEGVRRDLRWGEVNPCHARYVCDVLSLNILLKKIFKHLTVSKWVDRQGTWCSLDGERFWTCF